MPETSPHILACILHYGNPDLTRRLHRQMLDADPTQAAHIRVLDNAAPQPYSGIAVAGIPLELTKVWERLPENIYWTGAFEFALARAREEGYSHLWFLNNDVLFTSAPPYFTRATERLCRLQGLCNPVGIYAPAVERNPYHPQMVRNAAAQWRRVAYVDGIAPLVNLEAVDAVAGLDIGGNIYGYGVDIWLSLRMSRAGWAVLVDHQVAVKHHYHATARRVEGFLDLAARAENAFLTERLGLDYKDQIKALQQVRQDEYKI